MKFALPGWIKKFVGFVGGGAVICTVIIDVLLGRPDSKALKIWDNYWPWLNSPVPMWTLFAVLLALIIREVFRFRLKKPNLEKIDKIDADEIEKIDSSYDRSPLPPWSVRSAMLVEINDALALYDQTHGRKEGYRNSWVLEDLSRLATTYRYLIGRHAPLGGTHIRDAERIDKEADEGLNDFHRVLKYQGILMSLRDRLQSGPTPDQQ